MMYISRKSCFIYICVCVSDVLCVFIVVKFRPKGLCLSLSLSLYDRVCIEKKCEIAR